MLSPGPGQEVYVKGKSVREKETEALNSVLHTSRMAAEAQDGSSGHCRRKGVRGHVYFRLNKGTGGRVETGEEESYRNQKQKLKIYRQEARTYNKLTECLI